jgi:hypothetical protein
LRKQNELIHLEKRKAPKCYGANAFQPLNEFVGQAHAQSSHAKLATPYPQQLYFNGLLALQNHGSRLVLEEARRSTRPPLGRSSFVK